MTAGFSGRRRPLHARPHPPLSRVGAMALLGLLMVPLLEFGLWEAWHDAPTYDEGIYLSSGVDLLTSHRWRVTLEHPPLARAVAVLPALLAHPVVPSSPAPKEGDEYRWTRTFLAAQVKAGRLRMEVFLARLLPLLATIATGLVVYAAASKLTDRWGGVVAAGLWLTLPVTLGLGHLDSIDALLCLPLALTVWACVRVFQSPSWAGALVVGAFAGLDLLVRSTTLPVVLIGAVLVVVASRRLWQGLVVVGVAWASVWAGVLLVAPLPVNVKPVANYATPFGEVGRVPALFKLAAALPFPAAYSTGIRLLGRLSAPAPGYLLGHRWVGRWWPYWPLTLLAKVPLPAVLAVAIGLAGWAGVSRPARRWALWILAPMMMAVALPGLATTRQLGIRLLLPVLMLLAVAAAPAARLVRAPIGRAVLAALCVVQALALATAGGAALAWSAPPLHPGYRYLADSNLDWGQDWYRLRDWLATHDAWVAYFGSPGLGDVLPAKNMLVANTDDVEGWVAVSASYLTDYRARTFTWLRAYCPVDRIGSTVLLYRFRGAPSTAPGPDEPARPCWGAEVSHR